jgi:hypothetical protein
MFEQWQQSRTESLDSSAAGEENSEGLSRIDRASLNLVAKEEQEAKDQGDVLLLAELMQCLNDQERRLIRNRYLRNPAFSPCQLRRSMGGMKPEQLQQLEEQALAKLRRAAAERKGLDGALIAPTPTGLEQAPQPTQEAVAIETSHRSRPTHRPGVGRQLGRPARSTATRPHGLTARPGRPRAHAGRCTTVVAR